MKLSQLTTVKKLNSKTLNFIVGGTSFSSVESIEIADSTKKYVSSQSDDSYKKDR